MPLRTVLRYFPSIFFLCLIGRPARSQSHFTITGTINQNSGIVKLMPVTSWDYYPDKLSDSAKIVHGRFIFKGAILYPYCVRILETTKGQYISDYFFIDSGSQSLQCDVEAARELPKISNAPMTEATLTGLLLLDTLSHTHPDPRINHSLYTSRLLEYIRSHPNSYAALWKMVIINNKLGYDDKIDSGITRLSKTIQYTHTGQALKTDLSTMINAAPGKIFPDIALLDANGQAVSLRSHKKKYVLVDFWYHNCPPCLQTFDSLQSKLKNISGADYEIICVSIDNENDKDAWLQTIKKKGFPWLQYWDAGGVQAQKLGVRSYPTNFLLDENGTTLARDIPTEDFVKLVR